MTPHMLINTESGDAFQPFWRLGPGFEDWFRRSPTCVPVHAEPTCQRLDVSVIVLQPVRCPVSHSGSQLRPRTNMLAVLGPRRDRAQRFPTAPDAFVPHQLDRPAWTGNIVDDMSTPVMGLWNDCALRAPHQEGIGLDVSTDPDRRRLDGYDVEAVEAQEPVSACGVDRCSRIRTGRIGHGRSLHRVFV